MIGSKFSKLYSTSTNSLNDVFILSAARTPVGLVNGSFVDFSPTQVPAIALKESLERAKIPFQEIEDVFVGCFFEYENLSKKLPKMLGLKAPKIHIKNTSGLNNIIESVNYLLKNKKNVCAAIGVEVLTKQKNVSIVNSKLNKLIEQNKLNDENIAYISRKYQNLMLAYGKGVFNDEMIKILYRKSGVIKQIEVDEVMNNKENIDFGMESKKNKNVAALGDGAAALIFARGDYVWKKKLTPLARFISIESKKSTSFDLVSEQVEVIQKSLKAANTAVQDIAQWEINDFISNLALGCVSSLNIEESLMNKHGGTINLGNPISMSGARIICHLTHSLEYGKLGCAGDFHLNGEVSAAIIEKSIFKLKKKPLLTLYTKYPCPLCDDIKNQLKPFSNRFDFEEVNIEDEENELLRQLYRYEIPVLFLDGLFLCKNKLDVTNFVRRLEKAEKLRD